jgi:hypothetical protein
MQISCLTPFFRFFPAGPLFSGCHGQSVSFYASAADRQEHHGYALVSTRSGEERALNWSGTGQAQGAFQNSWRVMDDELELCTELGVATGLIVRR